MSAAQKILTSGLRWYTQGRLEEALELLDAARLCAETMGEHVVEARAWTHIGRASSLFCEPKVAEHAFGRAAACFSEVGDRDAARTATLRQSFMAYDSGDLDRSDELLGEVCGRDSLAPTVRGMAEGYRGNIARSRGLLSVADAHYGTAISTLQDAGDELYAATFQMDLAIVSLLEGNAKAAWDTLKAARTTAAATTRDPMLASLLAHYEALTAMELSDRVLLDAALVGFDAPACVAMDYLAMTHALMPKLAANRADDVVSLEDRLAVLRAACPPYEHGRLTLRIMRARLGGSSERDDRLVLSESNRSVRLGPGPQLRFAEASPEWLIMLALVEQLEAGQGLSVSPARLIDAGWPGEKVNPKSAKNRLHVTLSNLRKRGLREVLLRHHDGYALSRAVEVIRDEPPQSDSA